MSPWLTGERRGLGSPPAISVLLLYCNFEQRLGLDTRGGGIGEDVCRHKPLRPQVQGIRTGPTSHSLVVCLVPPVVRALSLAKGMAVGQLQTVW
jgi:hypothetical protein